MRENKLYYWYLVTNDEYELPVTPVFDFSKELADFLGISRNALLRKGYQKKNTENFGKNSKYKLVKVERK